MKRILKSFAFLVERNAGRCLGFVTRPIPFAAKQSFIFLVSISRISPWISVSTAPFFLELGRVGLDRRGPLIVKSKLPGGSRIDLDLAEKNQRNIYFPTVYEEGITRFVISTLKAGDTFVDVGANIGYFTLVAASLGSHVLSIEPDDENFALLKRNIQLNDYQHIRALNLGVGNREDTAILYVNPLNRGGNSLIKPEKYFTEHRSYTKEQIEQLYRHVDLEKRVCIKTLDTIFRGQGIASAKIIKIDVEGFEFSVVEGMTRILQEKQAEYIICELGNKETRQKVLELFQKYAYQAYTVDRNGELLRDGNLGRDIVFVS